MIEATAPKIIPFKQIQVMPVKLSGNWCDCPLCGLGIYACDCPPDLYAAAVYAVGRVRNG